MPWISRCSPSAGSSDGCCSGGCARSPARRAPTTATAGDCHRDPCTQRGRCAPAPAARARRPAPSGDELVVVDDHSSDATSDRGDPTRRPGRHAARPPGGLARQTACLLARRPVDRGAAAAVRRCRCAAGAGPPRPRGRCLVGGTRNGGLDAAMASDRKVGRAGEPARQHHRTDGIRGFTDRRSAAGIDHGVRPGPGDRSVDLRRGRRPRRRAHDAHRGHRPRPGSSGGRTLYSGRPDTAFRMYPERPRPARPGLDAQHRHRGPFAPWWLSLAVALWVWSLAGGWLAEPLVYPLSALQFWVLGRRAGSMHPVTALLYPLAVAVFVVDLPAQPVRDGVPPRRDLEAAIGGRSPGLSVRASAQRSIRILPTLALASMCRWASAMSSKA